MASQQPGQVGQTDINYDVFDKRLGLYTQFRLKPMCLYFVYLTKGSDGKDACRQYIYVKGRIDNPLRWEQFDAKEAATAVAAAVANGEELDGLYPLPGTDPNQLWFYRLSYIAFLSDQDGWVFPDNGSAFEALPGYNNFTFFDAEVLSVPASGKTLSVLLMINFMKFDDYGSWIGDDQPGYFKFLLHSTDGRTIDPGGTNVGPPEPPP